MIEIECTAFIVCLLNLAVNKNGFHNILAEISTRVYSKYFITQVGIK